MSVLQDYVYSDAVSLQDCITHDDGLSPASLRVFRYHIGEQVVQDVIGTDERPLPHGELIERATEALHRRTFMFYTVVERDDDAHELCFVPKGDHCDILSIHTRGSLRRYSEARRSLLDILGDLAGAVACGNLAILDADELAERTTTGEEIVRVAITDTASLGVARDTADIALRECGVPDEGRRQTMLGLSEAATNILLHGGGSGHVVFRILDDRLRFVVSDRGAGLNFDNWRERQCGERETVDRSASMGYGFRIMLDHLDAVGLHSGPWGTTLVLDRHTK